MPSEASLRSVRDTRKGLRALARWSHAAVCGPAGLELEPDRDRQLSRRAAVPVHVNRTGLRPEELDRLQHSGDVPPFAVTADIAGELAARLQTPLVVIADEAEEQIIISSPCRSQAGPAPALPPGLTGPGPEMYR
jgi:hypothetical protein